MKPLLYLTILIFFLSLLLPIGWSFSKLKRKDDVSASLRDDESVDYLEDDSEFSTEAVEDLGDNDMEY